MRQAMIDIVESDLKKDKLEDFRIGDTVTVGVRIQEGQKTRIQPYTGVVIARKGGGLTETITVRRIVNNEGVERIFPLHSPNVATIEIVRNGKARRAKLYYLRDRVGKARRLRERRILRKDAEETK
jgi:large subunit ribosomal protein L19